jgi:hypothetical protein
MQYYVVNECCPQRFRKHCLIVLFILHFVQLENYAKSEEAKIEELIKSVSDSGATVIVSGGTVGEMALHFCERYKYVLLLFTSLF